MKKILIAVALLATVASAQTFWTIRSGNYQIGFYPSLNACLSALNTWQAQGGYGYCAIAD